MQEASTFTASDPSSAAVDMELVRRVQAGDNRAFDLLVRKYQHRVIRLISRYIKDGEAADVAQEAFIKAWRGLKNFRGDSAFYTWLYRIAVNAAKNHLAADHRRPPDDDIEISDAEDFGHTDYISHLDTPENQLLSQELKNIVEKTIAGLPRELRMAITLREFEGLSYEEIADVMQCPIGTVRSRIFRAREAIEKVLKPLRD